MIVAIFWIFSLLVLAIALLAGQASGRRIERSARILSDATRPTADARQETQG